MELHKVTELLDRCIDFSANMANQEEGGSAEEDLMRVAMANLDTIETDSDVSATPDTEEVEAEIEPEPEPDSDYLNISAADADSELCLEQVFSSKFSVLELFNK